ncbi:hypothetical protein M407DRAFT_218277 [Tulasnella calospora MUT 4182]|uniref:Uncharacterized protein n=1 Tax=Tulasnella calospora MUT 4182 TaxID=1051891 RepID=A0A0C3KIX3_9AGAM|nr:hypothetical protein M407DRAFT_218277 [Tulasnella calospora MUT 4182]
MTSHYLFQGDHRDVLVLISKVEASCPQNSDSAVDFADDWNSLAADLAAAYLAGDALRWYEELDISTQESWASLRARLLEKFATYNSNSIGDESDESRGCRNSCLVAWPAPPPLTVPGSQVGRADYGTPSGEPQTRGSSSNTTPRAADGGYTVKIKNSRMQRLRAFRFGKPLPPPGPALSQSCFASHIIIDLLDTTPPHARVGWTPIEVELPLSGQAGTTTYWLSKSVTIGSIQMNFLRIGFRLVGCPEPHEKTLVYHSLKEGSLNRSTQKLDYWKPKPLRLGLDAVFAHVKPHTAFHNALKPGIMIYSALTITCGIATLATPQVVVGWQFERGG